MHAGLGLEGEMDSEAAAEEQRFKKRSRAVNPAHRGSCPAAAEHASAKPGCGTRTALLGSRRKAALGEKTQSCQTASGRKRPRETGASAASDLDSNSSQSSSSER